MIRIPSSIAIRSVPKRGLYWKDTVTMCLIIFFGSGCKVISRQLASTPVIVAALEEDGANEGREERQDNERRAHEARLGAEAFRQMKAKGKISTQATQIARIERVGKRIATVADIPNAEWEFVLFENPSPNAFALPGGKVGVHSGIFKLAQSDAALATVMSHEIAHVAARHSEEQFRTKQRGETAFTHAHELEADRMGVFYMAYAGYDPREAVKFWRRVSEYKQAHRKASEKEALDSHPLDEDRIQTLERLMPEAIKIYERFKKE